MDTLVSTEKRVTAAYPYGLRAILAVRYHVRYTKKYRGRRMDYILDSLVPKLERCAGKPGCDNCCYKSKCVEEYDLLVYEEKV